MGERSVERRVGDQELHPHESVHLQAERFAESADLAVLSFGDRDGEIPSAASDLLAAHTLRFHEAVFQLDAVPGLLDRRLAVAEHGGDVRSLELPARMRET